MIGQGISTSFSERLFTVSKSGNINNRYYCVHNSFDLRPSRFGYAREDFEGVSSLTEAGCKKKGKCMQFKQNIDDRRKGGRLTSHILVYVTPKGEGRTFEGVSSNISVTGLALDFEIPPEYLQRSCTVRIVLRGQHSNLVIESLQGVIVRSGKNSAAVTFQKPLEWFLLFSVYQSKLNHIFKSREEDDKRDPAQA